LLTPRDLALLVTRIAGEKTTMVDQLIHVGSESTELF